MDAADFAAAVHVLRGGGLVAFPTETVYGLGADAADPEAIHRLYRIKGRPADHPAIVHLADAADVHDGWVADWPAAAERLAQACWPGPLTIIVTAGPRAARETLGGADTIGLRVPAHPIARRLIRESGTGIAAPSANRFGRVSPTTAEHVRNDLGEDVDVILDGGPCPVGVESTIVDCRSDPPRLIRPGGIPGDRLEELLGRPLATTEDPSLRAPGTLPAHYAPRARVLVAEDPATAVPPTESDRIALLATTDLLDPRERPAWADVILDAGPDTTAYAQRLYALLREADRQGADAVIAVPPPAIGLGTAVRDRLERAARGTSDADERT